MLPNENDNPSGFDEAISARLRRLSAMPVDLGSLQKALEREIPRREPQQQRAVFRLFRPLAAVAASIAVLAITIAALLMSSSNEVMASPAQMAQFHQEIVSNKIPVTKVDSIESASRALAEQSPGAPDLPRAPEAHVMACCMKSVKDKKVACVLLKREGVPVTMTVAKASDMQLPKSPRIERDGLSYSVQSSGKLNMVMTEQRGRWICLIGELPADRLIDLAAQLRF